jgi:hypothetical protein
VETAISTDIQKNLGPSVASYGQRRRRWREAWIWPLPGFILSFILIITGLDWYYYGYTQYGPIAAQSWSQHWLFWGIFIGAITLIISIWQVLRSRIWVNLFQYGISVHLPINSSYSLRWEEITGIASATIQDILLGHILRTHHRLSILLHNGKPIILDDRLDNLLEFTTRLKANLYPRLLPGYRTRFQNGDQLDFGPLSIQSKVLLIRGKELTWDQVNRITVSVGNLIIETQDPRTEHLKNIRIPVTDIPNLELFLQVIQQGMNKSL